MNHRITFLEEGKHYETFEDILPDTNSVLDMLIIGMQVQHRTAISGR